MSTPAEIATNLAVLIDTRQFEIDSIDDKIKSLQSEKKRLTTDIDQFKDELRDAMWQNGVTSIEAPGMFEFKVSKPSVTVGVINKSSVPNKYMRIKKEVDKVWAKKELQSGGEIAGLELQEGKPRLTIKSLSED